MNVSEELAKHRVICGPLTVNANGVCRRRLRDVYDKILGDLSRLTTQEFSPPKAPKGHEIQNGKVVPKNVERSPEEKGQKMLDEGIVKNEIKAKLKEHAKKLEPKEKEPSSKERQKEMLNAAKMKAEVKVKAKEHETKLMGNSKLLQDMTGKITKR